MARRIRKTLWTRSFQRTLNALTRATVRAAKQAAPKPKRKRVRAAPRTAPSAPRRRAAKTAAATPWVDGVAVGPAGARRFRLWKPPGSTASASLPLLVMLHGCHQDAAGFARSTRMHALAAREGFLVLYPEQDRLANAQRCWNWFETRSGRAHTEAATILAAIDQVCARHGADPARVAIAGLSAGASMAALLAARHPERFQAVAMHSGVAPGAAHSTATALGAMRGQRSPVPLKPADATLPALLVIQGDADHIVRASNGRAAAQLWADALGAKPGAARLVQRGARRAATITDFKCGPRIVASLCEIAGLGHAWSGGAAGQPYSDEKGPDASRMIWSFASRRFKA
ncbi:MAG: PHB depolymerase family esterase [Burkholderiaceae bacterium]